MRLLALFVALCECGPLGTGLERRPLAGDGVLPIGLGCLFERRHADIAAGRRVDGSRLGLQLSLECSLLLGLEFRFEIWLEASFNLWPGLLICVILTAFVTFDSDALDLVEAVEHAQHRLLERVHDLGILLVALAALFDEAEHQVLKI